MKKADFRKLFDDKILILDGATGTNLMNAGMPLGVCPEKWILEHPQIMFDLQVAYLNAGTDILYAPTFTCNRIKLNEYGLADDLENMNRRLVELSKEAVKAAGHGLVAGDITMTGEMLYPMGKLKFEELIDVYKEQIKVIDESGCDLLVVETMMSLAETRAAVIAANEVSDLPIIASLTFNEDGRTLYGTDPVTAVNVLQNLGVAAIGVNCSTGPDKMVELVRQMKSIAFIPVFAKPNAGMPELVNDKSVYRMTPEEFAEDMKMIIEAGAGMVGGCCGTRPEHIKALADMASKMPVPEISSEHVRCISSERSSLIIDPYFCEDGLCLFFCFCRIDQKGVYFGSWKTCKKIVQIYFCDHKASRILIDQIGVVIFKRAAQIRYRFSVNEDIAEELVAVLSKTYPDLKTRVFGAMQRLPLPQWGVTPHQRGSQKQLHQHDGCKAGQAEKADDAGRGRGDGNIEPGQGRE